MGAKFSQLVSHFPFIKSVNKTTLIVIFEVFWLHVMENKIKVKIMQTTVFACKSKINLIVHDSEGMFYIATCNK